MQLLTSRSALRLTETANAAEIADAIKAQFNQDRDAGHLPAAVGYSIKAVIKLPLVRKIQDIGETWNRDLDMELDAAIVNSYPYRHTACINWMRNPPNQPDEEYFEQLRDLRKHINTALDEFQPDCNAVYLTDTSDVPRWHTRLTEFEIACIKQNPNDYMVLDIKLFQHST